MNPAELARRAWGAVRADPVLVAMVVALVLVVPAWFAVVLLGVVL